MKDFEEENESTQCQVQLPTAEAIDQEPEENDSPKCQTTPDIIGRLWSSGLLPTYVLGFTRLGTNFKFSRVFLNAMETEFRMVPSLEAGFIRCFKC